MIAVVGASGSIDNVDVFIQRLVAFSNSEHLTVQAFDATMIYSTDHLFSATTHARRAFQQRTNATSSLALEILLYAAGERQIEKAIRKIGVKKGRQTIVFLITDALDEKEKKTVDEAIKKKLLKTFNLLPEESILQGDTRTLKRFGITEKELSTVPKERYGDLILEKIAMVDVIKR